MYPWSLQDFYMKKCWILSKPVSASNEMTMWFFFKNIVYMVDYIDGFLYTEPCLYPLDEAYLIMMDGICDVFLYFVCQYFIEYFCTIICKRNWSKILFLCWIFVWFRYQGDCGLIEWVWQCSFCFYLWICLKSTCIRFTLFLESLVEFLTKTKWYFLWGVRRYLITASISLGAMVMMT